MANLVQTAANVLDQAGANYQLGRFGATVTAGQTVYYDSATGTWKLGQATTQAAAAVKGVALDGGASGQWGVIQTDGDVNVGATLVVGTTYAVSAAAGAICPVADLVTTNWVCILGTAISASVLRLKINATGVQVP